jgi:hypothetical protein
LGTSGTRLEFRLQAVRLGPLEGGTPNAFQRR